MVKWAPLNIRQSYSKIAAFLGGFFLILFITSFLPAVYLFSNDIKLHNLIVRSGLIGLTPILFFPLIYWISTRKPLFKNWKNLLLHAVLSTVFCFLFLLIFQVMISFFLGGEFFFAFGYESMESILVRQFSTIGTILFFSYWGVVVLLGLNHYYREVENMQRKSNELETQLQMATLSSLRAQLKPHFLFNTLSMVDQMIVQDPSKAVSVVDKLENLLKNTFDRTNPESCTITEEIAFIKEYLAIEQTRFHDRLEVIYSISPATGNIKIPRYLLQPLVENALVHGVGKTMKKCTVKIKTEILNNKLRITVTDNGPGIGRRSKNKSKGIGLKNVRERIKLYFGEKATLKLISLEQSGIISEILVPEQYLEIQTVPSKIKSYTL